MIPVTLLWVNTHGGYILSFVLQVTYLSVALGKKIAEKYKLNLDFFRKLVNKASLLAPADGIDEKGHNPPPGSPVARFYAEERLCC